MSFFEQITQVAGSFMGGSGSSAQDVVSTLLQHVGSMDDSQRQNLGATLLQTFTQHDSYDGDGQQAAQEAGTSHEDVAQGEPSALNSIIQFAQSNPQVLQAALGKFLGR